MKRKTKKIKPLPKLIKEIDALVSKYVRMRDGKCVTPSPKCTKVLQCSHLIRRGKGATRFDLRNCNCQCSYHNYLHNYSPEIYTQWFINKFGENVYNELVNRSNKIKKYTRLELENLKIALNCELENLRTYN